MKKYLAPLLLLLCIGCSDSDTTTGPGNNPNLGVGVAPKAGSWFRFTSIDLDSNGVPIVGSNGWEIDSIIQSGLTVFGKSNVVMIRSSTIGGGAGSEAYFCYESNGDVSMLIPEATDTTWKTVPFGSKIPRITHLDSVIFGEPYSKDDTLLYLGTETLTVRAVPLTASKVKMSVYEKASLFGSPFDTYTNTILSFSSSIGYFIHIYLGPGLFLGIRSGGRDYTLTDYYIK
jgi:hypothetical protein